LHIPPQIDLSSSIWKKIISVCYWSKWLKGCLLSKKRDHLKQTEKEQFQWTDFDSLKTSIKEIQAEQASKNKMRNWGRLKAFLEGMEQYEKLIEVFLNASDYLAFVWVSIHIQLGNFSS
jgi:hypothetical protein